MRMPTKNLMANCSYKVAFLFFFDTILGRKSLTKKRRTSMALSLKGTQTEKNLLIAFAGESQARNRYTFFASKAKDEGYQAISKIFLETAEQEKEHASRLFKFLEGGDLEITASYPAGKIGTTLENLQAAAFGEHEENTNMYPKFAQIAAQEGCDLIVMGSRGLSDFSGMVMGSVSHRVLRHATMPVLIVR